MTDDRRRLSRTECYITNDNCLNRARSLGLTSLSVYQEEQHMLPSNPKTSPASARPATSFIPSTAPSRDASSRRAEAPCSVAPEPRQLPDWPHSEAEEGSEYPAPQMPGKPRRRGRRPDTRERRTDRTGRESATGHFFRRFRYWRRRRLFLVCAKTSKNDQRGQGSTAVDVRF